MSHSHLRPIGSAGPHSTSGIEALAARRVNAQLGWYRHTFIYVCVIGGLAVLGFWQGHTWPLVPALGWGLGLGLHGFSAFSPRWGESMKANMLRRETERLRKANRETKTQTQTAQSHAEDP